MRVVSGLKKAAVTAAIILGLMMSIANRDRINTAAQSIITTSWAPE